MVRKAIRKECAVCKAIDPVEFFSTRGGKWPRTIHETATGFCVSTRYMGSYKVKKRGAS